MESWPVIMPIFWDIYLLCLGAGQQKPTKMLLVQPITRLYIIGRYHNQNRDFKPWFSISTLRHLQLILKVLHSLLEWNNQYFSKLIHYLSDSLTWYCRNTFHKFLRLILKLPHFQFHDIFIPLFTLPFQVNKSYDIGFLCTPKLVREKALIILI